jgi:transposase
MRGLVAARAAVLAAVVAIDGDIKRMVRGSDACRRLMSIPGVTHSDRPHRQAAES